MLHVVCCLPIVRLRRYRLISVVTHVGQLAGRGHYVAHVRKSSRSGALVGWRQCDDSSVRMLPDLPLSVATDAYLLFYVAA